MPGGHSGVSSHPLSSRLVMGLGAIRHQQGLASLVDGERTHRNQAQRNGHCEEKGI